MPPRVWQYSATFSKDLRFYVIDDEFGEKTISILLEGEESEMVFIDHPHVEMSVSITHDVQIVYINEKRKHYKKGDYPCHVNVLLKIRTVSYFVCLLKHFLTERFARYRLFSISLCAQSNM